MKITIEHGTFPENEIVLRCNSLDEEMLHILTLLKSQSQSLCVWDESKKKELFFISPSDILYGESVDEKTFLYDAWAIYRTAFSLAELCGRYEDMGYFRVGKSTILNLYKIAGLKSCSAGRIEATMKNGERMMISRHYAPLLRQKLGIS